MKFNITPPATCSTREAAEALGISVRTAQLWVEEGRLQAWKTPGGHRRILRTSVDYLVEQQQMSARQGGCELSVHILDLSAEIRRTLLTTLQAHFPNSAVTQSTNPVDGLLKIGEQPPNVLITSLHTASQDDFRIVEAVDRRPRLRNMLVILVATSDVECESVEGLPENFVVLPPGRLDRELLRLLRVYNLGRQNPLRAH